MTGKDRILAVHEQKSGHSVAWTVLDGGKIIMFGRGGFSFSDDGGLTWSQPIIGRDERGEPLSISTPSLVKLDGRRLGLGYTAACAGAESTRRKDLFFRYSDDEGKTWSAPVLVNPELKLLQPLQDVLIRTASGRLIFPVYMSLGQGKYHLEGGPFVGGLVQGNFVSTDAHFYDPHFMASFVYYSDDEGRSWRKSEGELFVLLEQAARYHGAGEPSVTEVTPGKLLMLMRTRLGRLFQAWSHNNGETWTRPQPTQLASSECPGQIRAFPETGHLLCVFNQQSETEVKQGFIRTRLSSAISRNGGGVWEHFQNVESLHEETHVEPGPIAVTRPAGGYPMTEAGAFVCDPEYAAPLPAGYGRWSYPSVLVVRDRVLISHTYSWHDKTGEQVNAGGSRLKVLPTSWFYGGQDPQKENLVLKKLTEAAQP